MRGFLAALKNDKRKAWSGNTEILSQMRPMNTAVKVGVGSFCRVAYEWEQ